MTLYIAVVSHGHDALIIANEELQRLALIENVEVLIRDNIGCNKLKEFASESSMHYLAAPFSMGFGANNNEVFEYFMSELGMKPDDYFCLHNPDLVISSGVVLDAVRQMKLRGVGLSSINLFRDISFTKTDLNIKRFPSLVDFYKGFICGSNPAAYDKESIQSSMLVDWASGAFLLFKADLFKKLQGFDERYFMYFEDVDICRRAKEDFGESLLYLPNLKATHLCQQANKSIFSRHFYWFISSMGKYYLKYGRRKLGF